MELGPKDWGIAIALALIIIERLFATVERYRKSADKRTTKVDELIASQLEAATQNSRDDYIRAEARMTLVENKFEARMDLVEGRLYDKLDNILLEIGALKERDAVMSVEVNSWPSHLKRVDGIQHDVAKNRDGINRLLIRSGLPPIDQTPPFGVETLTPSALEVGKKKD